MLDDGITSPLVPEAVRPTEASVRYLVLVDITGYTGFLAGVSATHGIDFSGGIPAGFGIIAALIDSVVEALEPAFEIAKLEGDAVFATAVASELDGQGAAVLARLRAVDQAFREAQRNQAASASDHICTACPVAATLSVKILLHRGPAVSVEHAGGSELYGTAVNTVHRLLKNTVRSRIGAKPYILLTGAAAAGLGIDEGIEHAERYDDVGPISGRIIELD